MPSVKIIPAGKLVNIQCKLNLGDTTSKVPMLFETEEIELPERLETISTIVSVKSGPKHRLKVPLLNNSKHDITLQKNSVIGRLYQIFYSTPLQVKQRKPTASTVHTQIKEHIGTTTSEQQQQVPPELDIKEHQMKV